MRSRIEQDKLKAAPTAGHIPQMFILLGPPGSGKDTIRHVVSTQTGATGARWLSKCTTRPLKRGENHRDVRTVSQMALSDRIDFFGHFNKNGNLYAYAVHEIDTWLSDVPDRPLLCIYSGIDTIADLAADLRTLGAMYQAFQPHFVRVSAPIPDCLDRIRRRKDLPAVIEAKAHDIKQDNATLDWIENLGLIDLSVSNSDADRADHAAARFLNYVSTHTSSIPQSDTILC